ncbi:nucleoid-associated protein [Curtobacterium sp. BRB10]|jgi:hypothetical protein|uniref:nucleoid-associated protein n=1 Tax=Curtobacterium sp. BRB10 TaxID=2962579 RepID=UPI002882A095|nr:nucleoid-associated protein [Curtobacterium sp. BRB10]MDT0234402.1 nucleoid-associated protein [Curtobacterium sp. BRB10]
MAGFEPITLNSTMLHELPRGRFREGEPGVVWSAAPTPLNSDTDRFVREEMLAPALGNNARSIVEGHYDSPVPDLVRQVLEDDTLLAENSREIADWLHRTQTGGSPAGVFMASLATVSSGQRFVILKAEHQEGVRLRHEMSQGAAVFEVEHLTELIMGQNSRVYKIAFFHLDHDRKVRGLMVDKQNGASFADYFLQRFLGCDLTHRAEVQMKEFVDALEALVNRADLPAEKRMRYGTAAVAVLESPAQTISPAQFISSFLDAEDRDAFAATLPSQVASTTFAKDTRLVKAQIGGLRLKTSTGVTLSASSEALENGTITTENDSDLGPRIIVKGELDDYSFRRPPSR